MRYPLDKSLIDAYVACTDYWIWHEENSKQRNTKKTARKILEDCLRESFLGAAYAQKPLYNEWRVDEDNPGFLIKFAPPIFLRVPFHLVPTFPSDGELRRAWELARDLQLGRTSTICISGSSAALRVIEDSGDIDFCEYLSFDEKCRFNKNIPDDKLAGDKYFLSELLIRGNHEKYPWLPGKLEYLNKIFKEASLSDESSCCWRFDYFIDPSHYDVVDASNLVLLYQGDDRPNIFDKTFAFQESPIGPLDWIPNRLADAVEAGRYIAFLISQISLYRNNNNIIKATKRGLSLSRFCMQAELSNKFHEIFYNSAVILQEKLNDFERKRDLIDLVSNGQMSASLDRYHRQLKDEVSIRLTNATLNKEKFDEQAKDIISDQIDFLKKSGMRVDNFLEKLP